MIKHFCDRCGKEIPPSNTRTYVQCRDQSGDVSFDFKSEYELCLDCKDELEVFLEGSSESGSCEFCKDLEYLPQTNHQILSLKLEVAILYPAETLHNCMK